MLLDKFFMPTGLLFKKFRVNEYLIHLYKEDTYNFSIVMWKGNIPANKYITKWDKEYNSYKFDKAVYISNGHKITPDYLIDTYKCIYGFLNEKG